MSLLVPSSSTTPAALVVAAATLIAGVVPPLLETGALPVTAVTTPVSVLDAPEIVLFVSVWVSVVPTTDDPDWIPWTGTVSVLPPGLYVVGPEELA
jgi:hypothetical protein